MSFEGYVVDRARWTLRWQGESVAVSRKTFDLLLYLIDRRDQVTTKDELLAALWPKQVVEESNLTQQIFLLRKALSKHESAARLIETVAGRGYRFAARIDEPIAEDPPPSATSVVLQECHSFTRVTVDEEFEEEASESPSWWTPRRVGVGAAALMFLGAAVFGWRFWETRTTGKPVVVVLADFDDASGDAALSHALDAAIRIDLSQSPFVTVLSPAKVSAILITMRQAKDAALTPILAREVCERNAAQVVLQGNTYKFGSRSLVSLRASSCMNGDLLAEDKREVKSEDDLPAAVDELSASVRRKLGESRASISRFDKPLSASNTASLGALKAYTAGTRLSDHGDYPGAVSLLQRAVELDPNYGEAYLNMTAAYFNLAQRDRAAQALTKAYQLRDTMGESNRMYTTSLYHEIVEEDIEAALEGYKAFAALVGNAPAYGELANAYDDLGQAPLAIEPAKRALELDPGEQSVNQILAAAQLHSGLPDDAARTCESFLDKNPDNEFMRDVLLMADYAKHDDAGVQAQLAWGRAHPGSVDIQADEINIAIARGENRHARALLAEFVEAKRPPGLQTRYDEGISLVSRMLADEGLMDDSRALVKMLAPTVLNEDVLVALAEDGLTQQARDGLQRAWQLHPSTSTLWKHQRAPQVEAALRLGAHEPQLALTALELAQGWERSTLGPTYLRGLADLEVGATDKAVAEFKKITESQWVDPTSNLYPISFLQMARAYAREHDVANAKASYAKFLDLWKAADADAPLLVAAKHELNGVL